MPRHEAVDDWDDPFVRLNNAIALTSREQARGLVRWFDMLRRLVLRPEIAQMTDQQLDAWIHDDDLREVIYAVRDVARDPQLLTRTVCALDVWTTTTRLEWGLAW
jgi:hypothetical protein